MRNRHKRRCSRWELLAYASAVALLHVTAHSVGRAQDMELAPSDTSRISLGRATPRAARSVTLDDIIALREVLEPRWSPDRATVAFIVRQGFRDCNCYRSAIFVVDTATGSLPRKLLEEPWIAGLRWMPDGQRLSYLSRKAGSVQVWLIKVRDRSRQPLFSEVAAARDSLFTAARMTGQDVQVELDSLAITDYAWSSDGTRIALAVTQAISPAYRDSIARAGVLFDTRAQLALLPILDRQWAAPGHQVLVFDVATRRRQLAWRSPGTIHSIAWSPDATRIAVSHFARVVRDEIGQTYPTFDIVTISVTDGTVTSVATSPSHYERNPSWSPDGRLLAYISTPAFQERSSIGVFDVRTHHTHRLAEGQVDTWETTGPRVWWTANGNELIFESGYRVGRRRERAGLYVVKRSDGSLRRLTSLTDHTSQCDDPAREHAACVRQSSNTPPAPALVDLRTGRARSLAVINPEFDSIRMAPVRELRWTNKYGDETNGYFITPLDTTGAPFPLLVIVRGFEGKFVTHAEWMTSYPAQVFARAGFAVLMANYPVWDNWPASDFQLGTRAVGYSPLASVEAAVRILAEQGLADSTRVGMMGLSYGAFLTEFALTHSDIVRVASVMNGGGYTPGVYGLLGELYAERVLGGPPYGQTLENWVRFSPVFNVKAACTPVLMEFNSREAPYGLEMAAAFRRRGVPIEFVIYPDDGHAFEQPEHRFYSMQRNLDWFTWWLRGQHDDAPAKRTQYDRWGRLRHYGACKGAVR